MRIDIKSFIAGVFVFALFAFTSQEILTFKPAKPVHTVAISCWTTTDIKENIKQYTAVGYQVKLYHSSSQSSFGILIMEKY